MGPGQELLKRFGGNRWAAKVALPFVAMQQIERLELLLRFDTLGDHL